MRLIASQPLIMKIFFLGTPEFAIPSLVALVNTTWIEVVGICTQTDKEAGRGKKITEPPVKKFAKEKNLLIIQTEKIAKQPEEIAVIKKLKPDVLITCAFGQILSQEVLDIAPNGVLNVHASLLPKYRGAAPINWAILNGEIETGVSIMKTELGLDSGPVLIQEKCLIEETETSIELYKKLSFIGASLLIKALEQLKCGKAEFILQDHSKATKAPSIKKELGLIDWNKSSREIHNQIRGLQPWPTAYSNFGNKLLKFWESRIVDKYAVGRDVAHNVPTGTIIELSDFVRVKTFDGFIDIHKLQPENKNIINSKDWVNGSRAKIGDRFGV